MNKGFNIKKIISLFLSLSLMLSVFTFSVNSSTKESTWLWPVPSSHKITALDILPSGDMHYAGQTIDIDSNGYDGAERLDVVSATSGNVLYIVDKYSEDGDNGSGFGNYVIVQYGEINILYAHLSEVKCKYGSISAGDIIGKMGKTGSTDKVHLHFMAYPKGQTFQSTEIYVFDFYISNPMYVESFEFALGLEKSNEYGDWISSYYTAEEQGYFGYSGGLDVEFPINDIHAYVMSVNGGGAPIRTKPINDNSYIEKTLSFGEIIKIVGSYEDAFGKVWLAAYEDGKYLWLEMRDVGFYDFDPTVKLTEEILPEAVYGSIRALRYGGRLTSSNIIESYEAAIYMGDSKLLSKVEPVIFSEAEIINLISESPEAKQLPDGEYRLVISVNEICGFPGAESSVKTTEVMNCPFVLDSSYADSTPPTVLSLSVGSVTLFGMTVSAEVSDNEKVEKVTAEVTLGEETKLFNCDINGEYASLSVDFSSFGGLSDKVQIVLTAYDEDGNSASKSKEAILPSSGIGEVWKANEVIRVRTGPGLGYKQSGTLYKGSSATVTEVVTSDGYNWGNKGNGWFAIDLSTYVSGYLYTVSFDLGGGEGSFTTLEKRFGVSLTLPAEKPTREGCEFLGWSLSSGSKKADYKAGGKFSDNSSVTLFAVWSDTVKPTITEVTLSCTEPTNQNVILTVNASDNTGELLYTFDGGLTWQTGNELTVRENTIFVKGNIAVRDSFGNITTYDRGIEISNIDREAPSIDGADIFVEMRDGEAIINILGVPEDESGELEYIFAFSSNKDMSMSQYILVENGFKLPLDSGLYYAELMVLDKAGNASSVLLDRFFVGTPQRLATPSELKIDKTTTSGAEISFKAVGYADKYVAQVALSEDFEDYSVFSSVSPSIALSGLLDDRTYYVRVYAMSEDGLFPPSDWSYSITFETVSGDSSIHSFVSLGDAQIDSEGCTASYTASYFSAKVDITAVVDQGAVAQYFFDADCKNELSNPEFFPFEGAFASVYIKVTSQGGVSSLHTLNIKRAAENAEMPSVEYLFENKNVFVSDVIEPFSVKAEVSDGGTITVAWYCVTNGGEASEVGVGDSFAPVLSAAGSYSYYAVITNTNEKCSNETASYTTKSVTLTVSKRSSSISVSCEDYFYNGKTPIAVAEGYTGDGEIYFKYFSDAECKNEIQPPVMAGSYYVIAYASETDVYCASNSIALRFTIKKQIGAAPKYSVIQPTLRDSYGHIVFETTGIEYRIIDAGDTSWTLLEGKELDVIGGKTVEARIAETETAEAGDIVTISIYAYDGAVDFVPNDSAVSIENGVLLIDKRGITAEEVKNMLENSIGVSLGNADGDILLDKEAVGTGCVIMISDSVGVFKSLTVVIKGDMNGDSVITREDAEAVMHISNGTAISERSYDILCGDIDGDKTLTSSDAYAVLKLVNK